MLAGDKGLQVKKKRDVAELGKKIKNKELTQVHQEQDFDGPTSVPLFCGGWAPVLPLRA